MDATVDLSSETTRSRHARQPLLVDVLHQCDSLQAQVDSAAVMLATSQAGLGRNPVESQVASHERCLAMGERARTDLRQISSSVADIVRALHRQIRDQDLIDHQLAAAVEQQEAAAHASLHDVLTGIPNRALFHDRLDHGLNQARRHSWDLALMFIDLDNFKTINDAHGHSVGDAVLRTIAGRLRDNTRIDDTVSRHGGDEFTYLALDIRDSTSVASMAGKLIEVIGIPFNVNAHGAEISLQVRASIGISIFPAHGVDADALIRSADRAMYQAKRSRSGYVFAS